MLNSLTAILCMAVHAAAAVESAAIPQTVIERAYNELTPALCTISYSYEATNPNTQQRTKQDAHLAGLIVSPDGLLMARGHMAADNVDPFNIRVTIGQGDASKEYPAALLEKPTNVNVAFLRIRAEEPLKLPYVRFRAESGLRIGDPVAILGILGSTFDYNPIIVERRVGSILDTPRTTFCLDDPVPPGFIGGPVINAQGEAIGVIGFDLSIAEGGDLYVRSGFPLIYQSELFTNYVASPPAEAGSAEAEAEATSWLGVFTQPLTDDLAEYWNLPANGGAVVSSIMAGSPASDGGMQRGDVIIEFNGKPVRSKHDREVFAFTRLVREAGVGQKVPVKVLRDGQPVDLSVTLAAQPTSAGKATEYEDKVFGLTVRDLTRDVRIVLNLPEDVQGVIVRRVESGSWAALANMRPGIIILNFGGHPVTTTAEFEQAVTAVVAEKPQEITVFSRVGPVTGFFRLEPRWPDAQK